MKVLSILHLCLFLLFLNSLGAEKKRPKKDNSFRKGKNTEVLKKPSAPSDLEKKNIEAKEIPKSKENIDLPQIPEEKEAKDILEKKEITESKTVSDPSKEAPKDSNTEIITITPNQAPNPKRKGMLLKPDDPDDMKRWAIVIGVNHYNDIAIGKLSKARNDAKVMGQILKEQGEFEKVFVMTDDLDAKDPLYPTRINIEEKLDNVLAYAKPEDMILFFFSGHGIADPEGNGYVLSVDTVAEKPFYTSVSVNQLVSKLNQKGIKKSLLLLDACRETISSTKGAMKEGLQAEKFENAEVAATFFSTKSGYYSFEDPKSDFGVFTKYLAYALEGKADVNGDGIVSFLELEEYVQKGVNDWSLANNKQQKPYVKYYKEKYGDLPITVRGIREKSLVEQNDYNKTESKIPFVWRSALFPGWGQYYAGSKEKGIIYSVAWVGIFGYFFQSYTKFNSAQSEYNSSFAVPGDGIFLPTYMNVQSKRAELENAQSSVQTAYFLLVGAWLWNMFDASVLTKQEKPKEVISFDFRKEFVPMPNGIHTGAIESRGTVKFNFEF
ncbi:MAG: caspase family protein [Leptospiraceae bacterium]|nr:caspase family protein [Leptospiraceae bacterium]